ncbi:hypothetical protein DWB61_01690 [Ancylomarina euxinus]|uniref:Alpha/beta hydrolase n=1 Tax=Ancylomarina euxinus TaxID=2283627 RepID=A0A425Y8H2_9BACT|nr:hypothetical protein [Ancylomarina euxinus]MCZ4693378.1 hypothetical protein [Ancylomarina euxinus]MUP13606.1 hypothetical protein [Ancylomarina euxinus]RRG24748.1 hypothetical protein DWB61_01690 [Ancylomarina euxinus]
MQQVIIGIHGLGNKAPKFVLEQWWKDSMKEGMLQAKCHKSLPEFEMVYWADILYDKPLDRWSDDEDSPYYLNEPFQKAPQHEVIEEHTIRQKLNGFISEKLSDIFLNDDKTLNYSFITDNILKRHFPDLDAYYKNETEQEMSSHVRDQIRERLVQVINKYKDRQIMILAHSMGTIISYDVLNFLTPDIKIDTLITMGSPLGLPIVIGKIAAEQKVRLNGKPVLSSPPGISSHWYNLADITDHVALHHKLADDFLCNETGIHPIDILVNNTYEMNGVRNPHKSYGYLQAPEFINILDGFIAAPKPSRAQRLLGGIQTLMGKVKAKQQVFKNKFNMN